MSNAKEFPQEYFLAFSPEDYREGRITVHQGGELTYWVEIDIVQRESRKIVAALDRMYGLLDPDEAVDLAVQKLSSFTKKL